MTKAELARSYAVRFEADLRSGVTSKKQVARIMSAENPGVFRDVEEARSNIRAVTGANSTYGVKTAYEFKSTIELGIRSLHKSAEVYELEPGEWGILSDIHIPYHDETAVESAIGEIKRRGIQNLILNGDLIDCHQISRFVRDPGAVSVRDEIEFVKQFFEWLRTHFSGQIVFKLGNHEARWQSYIWSKAPELEFAIPTIQEVCECEARGIAEVGSSQVIKAGKLNIIHGHEFGESIFSPVNPARGLFLRAKCSTICGHHHQTSEHHENNLNDDSMACWTTGCLCALDPNYRPFARTKWNHGFAILELSGDGTFHVENKRIIDGRVY